MSLRARSRMPASSQFEVCASSRCSTNRNDSCLYYYLYKKSSDTFASGDLGVRDVFACGDSGVACFKGRLRQRPYGLSIGMPIKWLPTEVLKIPRAYSRPASAVRHCGPDPRQSHMECALA